MGNPILSRSNVFTRSLTETKEPYAGGQQSYAGGQPYAGNQYYAGAQQPYAGNQYYAGAQQPYANQAYERMTIDDVIAKSAIVLGMTFLVALMTFTLVPIDGIISLSAFSAIAGFITVLVVSLRKVISVFGVLLYAVFEGAFIGSITKVFEMLFPGIAMQAVLATVVTAGATLVVYKVFDIKVTSKFRMGVYIATASLAVVLLLNLGLRLFSVNTGLYEVGPHAGLLSMAVSVIAVALALFNLIVDFADIEEGIQEQAPARESWRAALGLTVTLVWLYIEILRILSYFRD